MSISEMPDGNTAALREFEAKQDWIEKCGKDQDAEIEAKIKEIEKSDEYADLVLEAICNCSDEDKKILAERVLNQSYEGAGLEVVAIVEGFIRAVAERRV